MSAAGRSPRHGSLMEHEASLPLSLRQQRLSQRRDEVLAALLERVEARAPLVILRAPPGSGKTFSLTYALALSALRGRRIAVATFTNAQSDELASRLAERFRAVRVVRWCSSSHHPELGAAPVTVARSGDPLPEEPCVVVATSAKWATSEAPVFDALFVDEAWQLPWAEFQLLSKLAASFVLVGDPGQIEPVVSVETNRWETAQRAPHRAAPEVLLADPSLAVDVLSLPVTTRLPFDSAQLVQSFYDFEFDSWAGEGQRSIRFDSLTRSHEDRALALLSSSSAAVVALSTDNDDVLDVDDRAVAAMVVRLVHRVIDARATVHTEDGHDTLTAREIGVVASHRVMVSRIERMLGARANEVRVDTAERWQGLERALMIAVHPLSHVTDPSAFDLSTGRLCVMTSRHRAGLILVTRDHVGRTLKECRVGGDHALGCDDDAGRGHARNEAAWRWLEENQRVVREAE